jgi:hypothetical protein
VTIVLKGLDEVRHSSGLELGTTDWVDIETRRTLLFEAALRDSVTPVVPAHVDHLPEFLVLSLTNLFLPQLVEVTEVSAGVNYGTGRVRFPAAAPLGARLRGRGLILEVSAVSGGVQTTTRVTVEAEGVAEPVCVVDAISRWMQ